MNIARVIRRRLEHDGKLAPRETMAVPCHPTKRWTPGRRRNFGPIRRQAALRARYEGLLFQLYSMHAYPVDTHRS